MLTLLIGRDWTANTQAVFASIAEDVRREQGGRILMVPELISHEAERELCRTAGDTASRFAEVLSFTRLARRVAETVGGPAQECMDAGGRVVAMAAAARQLTSRLKAYAAVETKPEFLTELIDGIDEFKRCCITPTDLKLAALATEGSLAQKLEELSLLMETYEALCAQGKRDPRDQMFWLLEQLEQGDFAQKHVFYIDGFPDLTRQHMQILEFLICNSPSVTVSLNCDVPGSALLAFEKTGATASALLRCAQRAGVPVEIRQIPQVRTRLAAMRAGLFQGPLTSGAEAGQLHTLHADTPWQECMAAAHRCQALVRQGCRYRDITIVCGDMGAYRDILGLIFRRMNIPIYQSGTEDILQKSMIATVLTALDAALSGFDRKSVLRYLRSALSPLDEDTCDQVENYAILWGIRGSRWCSPWENHPDGLGEQESEQSRQRLDALNQARAFAIGPLERLRTRLLQAQRLNEQVEALYDFLEEIHLEERLADMARQLDESGDNRSAQILNQLWEILISALEQMYDVLGATAWEPEHFSRILRLLLSQYDVGTIPPVLDAVQVGPVNAMRCHSQKYLLVLGAQEGSLPGYSGSVGLLTDQERVALRELGVPLTGGAMEGIQEEFAEIYGVFCGALEQVFVSYSGEQPSFVFRRLAQLAGGVAETQDNLEFADANPQEAGAWLARFGAADAAEQLQLTQAYQAALDRRDYALGRVARAHVQSLYGRELLLSASQVDTQAECRLAYFLKYGMRAKERKEATVDSAEFGTYVHYVLEKTVEDIMRSGGFPQTTLERTLELAHRHSKAYEQAHFEQIDSERLQYLFQRNLRELDMVVEELWEELRQSRFQPRGVEVHFGGEGDLGAIPIPNDAMEARLQGFVDRVDVWQSLGSLYYRIVDYKTGKKSFDYCDVFNGIGLQMLLYLFALEHQGGALLGADASPAGVQYFPARVPYISADGRNEPTDRERQKHWRRSGLLLQDDAVLQAMEPGEKPTRLPFGYSRDGELTGDLADREQLRLLEGYVFHVLKQLVEEIASGDVTPNPYTRGSSHNACAFCPYGPICHPETVPGRRNYQAMKPQRFWEELEKERMRRG